MHPAAVHIYHGTDTFALNQARKRLESAVLDTAWTGFNLTVLGPDSTAGSALAAVQTMPFGAGGRLVVVTDPPYLACKTEDPGVEDLERVLTHAPPRIPAGNHLLFILPRLDQRLKMVKTLLPVAEVRDFSEAKPWQLMEQLGPWVTSLAKQHGRTITREATAALLEATGGDRWRIQRELEKLGLMLPLDAPITPADIQQHVHHGDTPVFALTDALAQRSAPQCLEALARILNTDHPLKLLAALVTLLRAWTRQKELLERGASYAQIAKETGARSDFKVRKDLENLRGWRAAELRQCLDGLLDVDLAIKSGGWPPELQPMLLEKWLIHSLASVTPKRGVK
jgi:DNA polymerase III delta subunit